MCFNQVFQVRLKTKWEFITNLPDAVAVRAAELVEGARPLSRGRGGCRPAGFIVTLALAAAAAVCGALLLVAAIGAVGGPVALPPERDALIMGVRNVNST